MRCPLQADSAIIVFPAVDSGVYSIGLYMNPTLWLPGTYDFGAVFLLAVEADRPAIYRSALDRYARISGSVTGSWQLDDSGRPRIEAFGSDSSSVGSTYAKVDGSFDLDLFLTQPVRLCLTLDEIPQWIGGASYETATVFAPQPGEHLEGVSVVESGIRCRLEGPGLLMNHDADISLRDEAGRWLQGTGYWEDPFSISNLRPGRYYLRVQGSCHEQTWGARWFGDSDSIEGALPIDLVPGDFVSVTIHLVEGGSIQGRIDDSAGQPIATSRVYAFDSFRMALCDPGHWTDRGTFDYTGLADGNYYLAVLLRTGGYWWYPGTNDGSEAGAVTVHDHAAVTGIEWSLPYE